MKVLVLGSGGREHALGWAMARSASTPELFFLPGNGGTARLGENRSGRAGDPLEVREHARAIGPDLVVIGPEAPLVAGVADALRADGYPVFGPSARAAEIEGSKVFAKKLMRDAGVPTASFEVFHDAGEAKAYARKGLFPKVIKCDGLAAGKGVFVVRGPEEADAAVGEIMETDRFGEAGRHILVETFLDGEEISAFAIARDQEFTLLPFSRDHKRIGDGDTGPNTGGMGAFAPVPGIPAELRERVSELVFAPTLKALASRDRPFRGLLYAGLMLVDGHAMVLEFNCRFGDPETQALMPLMGPSFLDALAASADDRAPIPDPTDAETAYTGSVVLASAGYPGEYRRGFEIQGIDSAEALPDTWVFHAGTRAEDRRMLTSGGRVLAVTGRGSDLRSALGRAYEGASLIEFEGRTFRRDIGRKWIAST